MTNQPTEPPKTLEQTGKWQSVKGFEGAYEVSSLGEVRSLPRMTAGRWGKEKLSPGKLLKQDIHKNGYCRAQLSQRGKTSHKLVHRLVAEAFLAPDIDRVCVNHIDSNRANNVLANLEWCTHKENTLHALAKGRLTHIPAKGVKTFQGAKEHCPKGHPYGGNNLYLSPSGYRRCRRCAYLCNKLRAEQRLRLSKLIGG